MLIVMFVFVALYIMSCITHLIYMALLNSIGLHWAFMKSHELGTKGYLKSLADEILNGA